MKANALGFYTLSILFLATLFSIGNLIERHQSLILLISYLTAFTAYLLLCQRAIRPNYLFALGLVARLSLFFSMPSLSDDIYRFIWDGVLLKTGIHPFSELPSFYLHENIPGITPELYGKLNSPEFFTIYPPINQFIFWLSVLPEANWLVSTNIIRAILLAADVGAFYLLIAILKGQEKPIEQSFLFFLNPLVILELTGNLHFEGLVVFFILLGLYFFKKKQTWGSALGFGLAVGTKLIPLIFLPAVFLKGLKYNQWVIAIIAGLVGFLTLLPMLNSEFIAGMSKSLDLYFRKFEFNAGIYFIAREMGYWIYGYNNIAQIGPLLSLISTFFIIIIAYLTLRRGWSIAFSLLLTLTIFLLFSTTVHPWYVIPLIAFGILSDFRFPILWSFLIFLTYSGYSTSGFDLPNIVVLFEYVFLISFMFFEFRSRRLTL